MSAFPEAVNHILNTLKAAGYPACCVGGSIRDLLLGRPVHDWDVTTAAQPEQVLALFAPHALPTGLQHGTVTVRAAGMDVEVTTFRRDGNYTDHRHPASVVFTASLEEDLSRRDFTINAMAMTMEGEIVDPFGGQADLRRGILRCVGEADKRLEEDALRILRALRFAAVYGFTIEEETARAIHERKELLRHIAAERIIAEMSKLICGDDAGRILLAYSDVIGVFIPEILPGVGFDQRNRHHCYTVWEHCVRAMEAAPKDPLLRYVLLFHDLGKPETFTLDEKGQGHFYNHGSHSAAIAEEICRRLKFDSDSRRDIVELVKLHDMVIPLSERATRRALCRLGEQQYRRLLEVKRCDNLAQHPDYRDRQELVRQLEEMLALVLEQDSCFSLKQLAVKGNDLLAMGLVGREIGATLKELLELVIDEELPNERRVLLEYVKEKRT